MFRTDPRRSSPARSTRPILAVATFLAATLGVHAGALAAEDPMSRTQISSGSAYESATEDRREPETAETIDDPTAADSRLAERFARLALDCVHREYPNKIAHVLRSDQDARPPRELTPAFFGCYDWHSAVHGHWLLARLARTWPDAATTPAARAALDRSLTPEKIAAEVRYLEGEGRISFERPYGLAWLLQLAAELREWAAEARAVGADAAKPGPDVASGMSADPDVVRWSSALEPLEWLAAERLREWIPKLGFPIRGGEHSQTAFAFGLVYDWAQTAGDRKMASLLRERVEALYMADRRCPMAYEPSGHDFLSPCLAEADLVRRLYRREVFAAWLGGFLPDLPLDPSQAAAWLAPPRPSDPSDPKLAHLDGLNLSRAWMLEGILSALSPTDPRVPVLIELARSHRAAGLESVTGEHYEGGHWLGSFATYLVTGRGGGNLLSEDRFDLTYRHVPRHEAAPVLGMARRAFESITGYLGIEYDGRIRIDIGREHDLPRQQRNRILLPAYGLLAKDAGTGISVVHEMTHVVAPSAHRPDRFYDDGLAVYLQTLFGERPSYPLERGGDLHAETARLAAGETELLPLAETEATRRRTRSGSLRRLAYLQEGSFTRFLIESRGLDSYWRVYRGEGLETVYEESLEALEAEWRQQLPAVDD